GDLPGIPAAAEAGQLLARSRAGEIARSGWREQVVIVTAFGAGFRPRRKPSPGPRPPARRGASTGRVALGQRRMSMASSLVVLKFDSPEGANKALEVAQGLQKQHLLELLDAATVVWPKGKKKPKTRHLGDVTCAAAWDGAFWGM